MQIHLRRYCGHLHRFWTRIRPANSGLIMAFWTIRIHSVMVCLELVGHAYSYSIWISSLRSDIVENEREDELLLYRRRSPTCGELALWPHPIRIYKLTIYSGDHYPHMVELMSAFWGYWSTCQSHRPSPEQAASLLFRSCVTWCQSWSMVQPVLTAHQLVPKLPIWNTSSCQLSIGVYDDSSRVKMRQMWKPLHPGWATHSSTCCNVYASLNSDWSRQLLFSFSLS